MTTEPVELKLFRVSVLFPNQVYWTRMSILAESEIDALKIANRYGVVGTATEEDPIPELAVDFHDLHPEQPLFLSTPPPPRRIGWLDYSLIGLICLMTILFGVFYYVK
jgi:hypothetical protein